MKIKLFILFFLALISASFSQTAKVIGENGMTEVEFKRKGKLWDDIEALKKREEALQQKLPVIGLTSGDCTAPNAKLDMAYLEEAIVAHEHSQAKNVCLQIVRKYQELHQDYTIAKDNECDYYDYNLKKAKQYLQAYKDCFNRNTEADSHTGKEIKVKFSDTNTSASSSNKKETITKAEYDQYQRNAENYKSEQRLKTLKTSGYTDGQARVMVNYESEKQTDTKVAQTVSGLAQDLFAYDEDAYFARQNRMIKNRKERLNKKYLKDKEKRKEKQQKKLDKAVDNRVEELEKQETFYNAETKMTSMGRLKNNKKEGEWTYIPEAGYVQSKVYFKNGIPEGPFKQFHENGKLALKGDMKNGKREGKWSSYDNNGVLRVEGNFVGDLQVGITKIYNEAGKHVATEHYKIIDNTSVLVSEVNVTP